jgi:hypothetical protein
MIVFKKTYDGESIYDLERDIAESIDERFNDLMSDLPTDENGFTKGKFKVTIEWEE